MVRVVCLSGELWLVNSALGAVIGLKFCIFTHYKRAVGDMSKEKPEVNFCRQGALFRIEF